MKPKDFQRLSADLEKLTLRQKQLLVDSLRASEKSVTVSRMIESRLGEKPVCPHCGHEKVNRWGMAAGLQRYRCGSCRSTFNALTGTPLARLRHKDQWLTYAEQMAEGRSVRKSATACQVHRNTAFRWRHRFLELPDDQRATLLSGIAEADETVFLESFKGRKVGMPRAPRRRGGKAAKRGLSEEQIPVLICRDRSGNMADFVVEKADQKHLRAVLKPLLPADAILCTDGGKALGAVARELGIVHRSINLAAGIRVVGGVYHIQNVNAYDSRLKQWMLRFHGVATHYLGNYLGWRRLIERHHNAPSPKDILLAALGICSQQLTVT